MSFNLKDKEKACRLCNFNEHYLRRQTLILERNIFMINKLFDYSTTAITSISIFTSFGSLATSTADRAGLCSPK